MDACGLTRTCAVTVTALDDVCSGGPPAPTNVTFVAISLASGNVTLHSLGNSTWSVAPEYTTNLMGQPQNWQPVPTYINSHFDGTNVTSFQPPTTNTPVLYRIWQKYP
jgi:hypothetical protein